MSGKSSRKNNVNENTNYKEIKFAGDTKARPGLCILSSVLAVLFFITSVVFVILFVYYFNKYNEQAKTSNKICQTQQCFSSAVKMFVKMNQSADPCADFSEFACGRFMKEVVIPQGKTRMESFSILADENHVIMKDIVTEDIKQGEPLFLTNMKRLYHSCMDEAGIEEIGLNPYMTDPLVLEWPTLNKNWTAPSQTWNLREVSERYAHARIMPFFSLSVNADVKNSSTNVIYLIQPLLGLPQEYFGRPRNDTVIMAYQRYLADIAVELGASRDDADRDAAGVVDLKMSMFKIMVPTEETRDANKLNNPTTLGELQALYPHLSIAPSVRATFNLANMSLPDDERIINRFPTYMGNMSALMTLLEPRTVLNMFGFTLAISRVEGLTKRMRDIKLEFDKVFLGITAEKPRWEICLITASNAFGWGMGKYFVAKTFTETSKTYMEEMIDNLKKVFKQMIEESTWMGQATKDEAFKKLTAMRRKVGYPDAKFEEADIETMYKKHFMSEREYYANCELIQQLDHIKGLLTLRKPVDKNMFSMDPFVVNAYYSENGNEIVFPAGILQPPFFSPSSQDSMNYGSIGVVIGHEITHGFDDQGAQFDADGNLRNWWQESDLESFLQRTQCIVNQTSDFWVEEVGMRLNGINTQGESVADNGGIKESFRAYKELTSRKGEQPTLPGLGLTQDQLFFLSFSQSWCEKMTPESWISQITTDVHPPGIYRIIGPLQNSEDFAKAYNCPRGSYMNPEKKCDVW